MLNRIREKSKSIISHQDLKTLRSLRQNLSYPPFIYHQFTQDLILILGCQRSGNTLTYLMLNSHPQINGIDESDSDYRFPKASRLKKLKEDRGLIALKFPLETYKLEYYQRVFSSSKVIWSVRNPYATVSSMLHWKQKEGNWIKVYAKGQLWQHSFLFPEILELDLDNLDEVSLGAYVWKYKELTLQLYQQSNLAVFAFKYENLLESPELIMNQILNFVGLPWSENVLHHEQHYQGTKRYPGGTRGSDALDKSRKKPKLALSTAEIDLITEICGAEMQPYGYENMMLLV